MNLIGLVGRAGTGKTTVAKHIEAQYGFRRLAFADPLKQMLLTAGMCRADELWGEKTDLSRWLLQKIGTDIFRRQVDPLFWVKKTADAVKKYFDAGQNVVIDDIRFPEEAALVRSYLSAGLLIRLERGDYADATAGTQHESENMIHAIDCDYIVMANSGEIDRLIWQVDEILQKKLS